MEKLNAKNLLMCVNLIFKNSAGNYLYKETNSIYKKDSLKIYDQFGNRISLASKLNLIPNTSSTYGEFDFGPIYNSVSDTEAFNSELCKKNIFKYYDNISDTITVCFMAAVQLKGGSEFSKLKVYHKGLLLLMGSSIGTYVQNCPLISIEFHIDQLRTKCCSH